MSERPGLDRDMQRALKSARRQAGHDARMHRLREASRAHRRPRTARRGFGDFSTHPTRQQPTEQRDVADEIFAVLGASALAIVGFVLLIMGFLGPGIAFLLVGLFAGGAYMVIEQQRQQRSRD